MTTTRPPLVPVDEERLRRDLRALADQLVSAPDASTGRHSYIALVPAGRRRWPAVAAAAVLAVIGVGTALAGGDGPLTTSSDTVAEASEPTTEEAGPASGPRTVEDADRALAAAVDALRARWGAEFAPTVLDDVRADRAELEAAHPPADDVPGSETDVPEQVVGSGFPAEGRLEGLRLTVSVVLFVVPASDLSWVDASMADSVAAEPVAVDDEGVRVWSVSMPAHDGSGGSTIVRAFTPEGVVHIGVDHQDGTSPFRPEDAVGIARATFAG